AKDAKGKPAEYDRLHLVFAADGDLAERQVVRMPKGEIVYRETYAPDGVIRVLPEGREPSPGKNAPAGDKDRHVLKGTLAAAKAPALTADVSKLVVLALPHRTAAHVRQTLNLGKKEHNALRFDEGLPLLAAEFAANNGGQARAIFQQCFHAREQRQLGYYVLLAASSVNLDAQNADVLAEHADTPLAQYLALHSSPVLRQHASQGALLH